jgi:hypothetical protein
MNITFDLKKTNKATYSTANRLQKKSFNSTLIKIKTIRKLLISF